MADVTAGVAESHRTGAHQTGHSRREVQSIARKYDPTQPRDEQGQWSKTTGRSFTSEEGYQWHEKGPVVDWVKTLPTADVDVLGSYAGFGYREINNLRRGVYEPPIVDQFVRPATPEEIARVGYDPVTGAWIPAIKVSETEYKSGSPVDPRDQVTPETIERFGHPLHKREAKDYDPDDPYHKVDDGRIIVDKFYTPVEGGPEMMFSIRTSGPNLEAQRALEAKADRIDALIRDRGYVLPEAIEVQRGAYLPGVSHEDLQQMVDEGSVWEEKGFTSTMVGDAGGRAKSYPALGKWESIYQRFPEEDSSTRLTSHQDEVGSAVRFHITLPEGTRVASVESARRIDHTYPRIPHPDPLPDDPFWKEHPHLWTKEDKTQPPIPDTKRLEIKDQRTESELLLGSGAQFRVTKVTRGENYNSGDPSLKPVPIMDVHLEYIGGGSSEGTAKKAERTRTVYIAVLNFGEVPVWR